MVRLFVLLSLLSGATVAAGEDMTALIGFARQGDAVMPGADADADATVAAQEHYALLKWPVHRSDRHDVSVGFNYQYTRFEYTGVSSRNRDLHHLQLPVRLVRTRGERRISAYLAPGIATSSNVFKDFLNRGSADDWYVSGAVEAQFGRPDRQWLIGTAYDRSFGKDRIYPILGLRLSPRNDVDVRLAFPVSGVAWHYSDGGTLTGRLMPAGFQWRVVTDDFANEFNYHVEGIRAQLHWTRRVLERWSIDLSAAYETDRRHELVSDLGDRIVGHPQGEWRFAIAFGIGRAAPVSPHGLRIQSVAE